MFDLLLEGGIMLRQQIQLRIRLYARLSKDDGDSDKESNSITNQLVQGRQWCKANNAIVVGEYTDDGFSGTTFERPYFKRMMDDILSDPLPSGVWVKDMSRFGRNNAMFMYYVDEFFPKHNIQFIAENDGVDTRYDDNDLMPFKSIINEYYARDQSKKSRSAKMAIARSGGFNGSFAPYGYIVDPNNKRKLLIDLEASKIVKKIFELARKGRNLSWISRYLLKLNILIPRAYRMHQKGQDYTGKFITPTYWSRYVINSILKNQVYIGHMVSHKSQTTSFKNKKLVKVPEDQWIIVKNTHEAIIDEETFEIVQKFLSVKKRTPKKGNSSIFVGLIKCADCGRSLRYSSKIPRRPAGFICSVYARNRSLCTTHWIRYELLVQIVLNDIKYHIGQMEELGDEFISQMKKLSDNSQLEGFRQLKKDYQKVIARIEEIDLVISKLFEQSALGKIENERFEKMSENYELEQKDLHQKAEVLLIKIEEEEGRFDQADRFVASVKKYKNVEKLNREMLCELVDSIQVHQAEGAKGVRKNRTQKITINYRFFNQVELLTKGTSGEIILD